MKSVPQQASFRIASLCLVVGLLLTFASVAYYRQSLAEFRARHFAEFVDKATYRIAERVLSYDRGLRGMRSALLATGPQRMTLSQFHAASLSRDPEREFPGTQGFGFIQRVPAGGEAAFIAEATRQGRKNLRIQQLTPHDGELFIIKYLEPEANRPPIGMDIASEANRRAAMLAAMRSDKATLTAPVTLMQANGAAGQGFLLLLPVYPEYPIPEDPAAREAAAVGATYALILLKDMLASIDPIKDGVSLTLSDVDPDSGLIRFFGPATSSPATHLAATREIEVFGRHWQAEFHAQPAYITKLGTDYSISIGLVGTILSLLLTALAHRELLARQLRQQTGEYLQLLIKNAPTALAMFDHEMRYLAVSQRWIDEFSLADKEFIGKSHYDLYPRLPEHWKEIHQRALNGEELSRDNERFQRRNGSYRWLHWAIRPWYKSDGTIGGVVIFTEDVTERHLMIDALEKAKESAEYANRAKTLFLGNMSHEMRTPLHQLNGLVSLFQRDSLTDRQSRRLEQMKGSLQRLDTVIGGILTLVNLESKATSVNIRPLDMQDVIASVISSQREAAEQKELRLDTAVAPLPTPLQGDAGHIRTILACYLNNAIKFSTAGTITVRADNLWEDESSALIKLAVTDQGIGIPPDKADRLFELFEQIDNSQTRAYGGTGIGLAIAKKLAELMGGEVGCDSTPGQGSTFWLTLKLAKRTADSLAQEPAKPSL